MKHKVVTVFLSIVFFIILINILDYIDYYLPFNTTVQMIYLFMVITIFIPLSICMALKVTNLSKNR
ncbi:MAG: hypothetical protein FH753_02050 [Firmicutes bacterium]|nr:hypothetical protein [Bacillota bacterium]